MGQPVGLLSGGQRQALTLLMATMVPPELLLLDEHTAALDPGTAEKVLALTERIVEENHITCLMVTHNMTQALALGNRTLMMADGGIVLDVAGEERAGALLDAWTELDAALRLLRGVWLDNFVMMPLVSQRLINRPFVPLPQRLTQEETAYYRPFLFQATTEEQASDLMNIQGMDFIRGFSGTRMASLAMKDALLHLARSREKIAECGAEKFALLERRLRVLQCLIHTLDNACRYQEILDRTLPDETAPLGTQWPAQGDERILKLGEIARAEIDNCYALAGLLEGYETELFNLTDEPENEDIFVMTTALPAQLRRKAEIMLDHMRDADAVYETNNK